MILTFLILILDYCIAVVSRVILNIPMYIVLTSNGTVPLEAWFIEVSTLGYIVTLANLCLQWNSSIGGIDKQLRVILNIIDKQDGLTLNIPLYT
jgi:hypothetical protein